MVGDFGKAQQDRAQQEANGFQQQADIARRAGDAASAAAYDDKARQAQGTADNWSDNGVYRLALHAGAQAAVGGATGGARAAAGAAGGPGGGSVGQQLGKTLGEQEADKRGLTGQERASFVNTYQQGLATVGGVIGGAVAGGGTPGAAVQGGNAAYSVDVFNRQLHPDEKVLAKELARKSNGKYTAEQIEAQMRGTAVTRNGVTEPGIPDTVVGGKPGIDNGGTWVYAGTTPDGKPIITQQLAPENIELKAYIANNTQGQAGIVYPTITLSPTKSTPPERLPQAPAGTTRVTTVVDGVAYYPLVANCPAAACLNGDPIANAIPDPGTQAYVEAVDRKVDRTVNIVSGVLGVGGAVLRGGGAVAGLLAETSGAARVAEGVAGANNAGDTVSLFRKMSATEADATLDGMKLQPSIPGSNSSKYLSESMSKVENFQNAKVTPGSQERILEFIVDKKRYDLVMDSSVNQAGSKGIDAVKYNFEGINSGSGLRNIGIPPSQLDLFNSLIKSIK